MKHDHDQVTGIRSNNLACCCKRSDILIGYLLGIAYKQAKVKDRKAHYFKFLFVEIDSFLSYIFPVLEFLMFW